MKFLKGLALSLLGLLLFLSLSSFGLVYMVDRTILNPKFVTAELDRLDASSLVQEMAIGIPPEFQSLINDAEPLLKEQLDAAIFSTYDYLLSKKPSPEIAKTLRNTILSKNFFVSIIDKADISSLAAQFLKNELAKKVPPVPGFPPSYLADAIDDIMPALEPWIKEQAINAADPVLDYIVGERQSFNVAISLSPVKTILEDKLRELIMKSLPPELAALPPAEQERQINFIFSALSAQIPSTVVLNETVLGKDLPTNMTKGITEVENFLVQARQYVSYAQMSYWILIVLMLLLVAGIVLIHRQIKSASRELGTTFIIYGAFDLIFIYVGNYFADKYMVLPDIPRALNDWVVQFSKDLLNPLITLNIIILVIGIALLVVSFVYRGQPSPE
ncbi:MAG: hypothetical protein V1767_02815 [Chloroflexota bacterium]